MGVTSWLPLAGLAALASGAGCATDLDPVNEEPTGGVMDDYLACSQPWMLSAWSNWTVPVGPIELGSIDFCFELDRGNLPPPDALLWANTTPESRQASSFVMTLLSLDGTVLDAGTQYTHSDEQTVQMVLGWSVGEHPSRYALLRVAAQESATTTVTIGFTGGLYPDR
jgi:hypothetical protein